MAMIGDLEDFGLAELLQVIGRGSKSGQLSVWTPSGVSHIWFYQGRVVAASPPGGQPDLQQRLQQNPEIQVQCGGSAERVVTKLANLCGPSTHPLGACVRKQGLISGGGLTLVFRQQLQDGVYPLFELESGQFNFNAKAPIPYGEMTGLSKECLDIAIEGLRRVKSRDQQIRNLPSAEACFCRTSDDLPLARLSPVEWNVWERVSPHRLLQEIAQEMEIDLPTIQYTCGRLLQVGLIQETVHSSSVAQPSKVPGSWEALDVISSDPAEPEREKEPINSSLLNRLASALRGIQKNRR